MEQNKNARGFTTSTGYAGKTTSFDQLDDRKILGQRLKEIDLGKLAKEIKENQIQYLKKFRN